MDDEGTLTFTDDERAHARRIVEIVGPIIEPLARALQPRTEVVLHDLTSMPGTIAATYFNWRKISIYGGSNEIQKNIIAKAILGL